MNGRKGKFCQIELKKGETESTLILRSVSSGDVPDDAIQGYHKKGTDGICSCNNGNFCNLNTLKNIVKDVKALGDAGRINDEIESILSDNCQSISLANVA